MNYQYLLKLIIQFYSYLKSLLRFNLPLLFFIILFRITSISQKITLINKYNINCFFINYTSLIRTKNNTLNFLLIFSVQYNIKNTDHSGFLSPLHKKYPEVKFLHLTSGDSIYPLNIVYSVFRDLFFFFLTTFRYRK